MQETTNLGLRKPGEDDFINVEDLNHNSDIIDQKVQEALDKTVDIVNDLESDRQDAALSAAAGKRLFQSASNGKSLIAGAVTGKGVSASSNDTFAQLAGKITQIKQGKGNATPDHVIFGRTFSNDQGDQTGTMPNRGNWSSNMSIDGRVTIPQGYHAGGGAVTADVVPGRTITPTTYEQTAIGPGSIASDTIRVAGDPDLQSRNIRQGVNIFGVPGSAKTDYSAEQAMIANAITNSGVPTSTTASWQTLVGNIGMLGKPAEGVIYARADDNSSTGTILTFPFPPRVAIFYQNETCINFVFRLSDGRYYTEERYDMDVVKRYELYTNSATQIKHFSGNSFKLRPFYYLSGYISVTSANVNWKAWK